MEFIQCLNILRKEARLFWSVVFGCTLLALLWQQSQGPRFEAIQLLNVGRNGAQATTDYTYDGFYRLQADERFADTAVRWLGSPRVVEDIYREAEIGSRRDAGASFQAGRLSSQMVEVRYEAENAGALDKLGRAIPLVLNRYAESLNRDFRETSWFVIVPSDPVVKDARTPALPALSGGFLLGLFLAFWGVLLRHYLQETKNKEQ